VGAYIGGDDLSSRLKWFSAALFFPSSLWLVAGLSLTSPYLVDSISSSLAAIHYSEAFRAAAVPVIIHVTQQVGSGILLTGGVTCLIALALLILSLITPATAERNPRMIQIPAQHS
jgi:hypothetical protein